MLTFWIAASVLTVLALAFIVPPLLKNEKIIDDVQRDDINVAIYQERLAELKKEHLTDEQLAAAKAELDQTLLHDIEHETDTLDRPRARFSAVLAVTVLVPALAIAMYWRYGEWQLIEGKDSHAAALAMNSGPNTGQGNNPPSLPDSVARLAERLAQNPDDLEGWIMLARSYNMLGQAQEAAQAYTKAMALMPEQDPNILAEAAEALAAANDGRMGGQPEILVQAALALDPNNQRALFFAGVAAMQKQAFPQAVDYWQTLLTLVPEEQAEIKQVLTQQIARAQQLANADSIPPAATQPTTETITDSAQIQVTVSLDAALETKVTPEQTVFIYARPVNGPPMPVAIARATVSQLPITVTLDDSSAMMPNQRLSQFDTVAVIARISATGQAMPQPGDWVGPMTTAQPATQPTVAITINQPYGAAAPAAPAMNEGEPTSPAPTAAASTGAIEVQVDVAPALQTHFQPSDTVFIFAKAVNGPPMPLAVVRKTAAELPFTVTLSDDMAMMPNMKLSNFLEVSVSARISSSGEATPVSGDLLGMSQPFTLAETKQVAITIDQTVP